MDRFAAMQTFISVVESGSFSGAARSLRVGQPSVSKTIARLEESLGVKLVLRSSRGLTPTEAGRAFYTAALSSVDFFHKAEMSARGVAAGLTGQLRVCAPVTFARLHVMPHLPSFFETHPDISIDVVLDDRNIDLLEAGIDVALRMGTLEHSSMTARRIASFPRLVVGTPGYFDRAGMPQAPVELSSHQAIVYEWDGRGAPWLFKHGDTEVEVAMTGRLRVTAAEGLRAAVLSGFGLAVASESMFAPELENGEVVPVVREWSLPSVDLWAVFPSGRRASAKARAFVSFVESTVNTRR